MNTKKSLYRDSNLNTHTLLIVAAVGMILTSIYLTQHYFSVHFPTTLVGASFCDINSFFNCDSTTLSPASNIFGIPISVFGLVTGIIILLGYMFKDEETESAIYLILGINLIGCLALFAYSLIIVNGICPFCTLYYLFSIVAFLIFYKCSSFTTLSPKFMTIAAISYLVPSAIFFGLVKGKLSDQDVLAKSLIGQFEKAVKLPEPQFKSPYVLNKVENAPVQINIYSDFQCPACRALSEFTHQLIKRFKDSVNISYYFYPLDNNCNPDITRSFHTMACKAAYLASCLPEKFVQVHDDIFKHQDKLSNDWIEKYAQKEGVKECANSSQTRTKVQQILSTATAYDVKSTPTMIINGVKIEGILPPNQMFLLIEQLIQKGK